MGEKMFTKEDLGKFVCFKKIISQGDFEIKGEAVIAAASLFDWFNKLEKVIVDNINKAEKKPAVFKPLGAPKPITATPVKKGKK